MIVEGFADEVGCHRGGVFAGGEVFETLEGAAGHDS